MLPATQMICGCKCTGLARALERAITSAKRQDRDRVESSLGGSQHQLGLVVCNLWSGQGGIMDHRGLAGGAEALSSSLLDELNTFMYSLRATSGMDPDPPPKVQSPVPNGYNQSKLQISLQY